MPTTSQQSQLNPGEYSPCSVSLLLIFRNLFIDILENLSDFNATKVNKSFEVLTMDAKCLPSDFVHSLENKHFWL